MPQNNTFVSGVLGDNANAGTREAPYKTIQAAVDAGDSLSRIHVRRGETYAEEVTLNGKRELYTWGNPGVPDPVIDGAGENTCINIQTGGSGSKIVGIHGKNASRNIFEMEDDATDLKYVLCTAEGSTGGNGWGQRAVGTETGTIVLELCDAIGNDNDGMNGRGQTTFNIYGARAWNHLGGSSDAISSHDDSVMNVHPYIGAGGTFLTYLWDNDDGIHHTNASGSTILEGMVMWNIRKDCIQIAGVGGTDGDFIVRNNLLQMGAQLDQNPAAALRTRNLAALRVYNNSIFIDNDDSTTDTCIGIWIDDANGDSYVEGNLFWINGSDDSLFGRIDDAAGVKSWDYNAYHTSNNFNANRWRIPSGSEVDRTTWQNSATQVDQFDANSFFGDLRLRMQLYNSDSGSLVRQMEHARHRENIDSVDFSMAEFLKDGDVSRFNVVPGNRTTELFDQWGVKQDLRFQPREKGRSWAAGCMQKHHHIHA